MIDGDRKLVERLGIDPQTEQGLADFSAMLLRWNEKINLISRRETQTVWQRHILDSAQILPLLFSKAPGVERQTWCDIGTGGGLPGVVVAIWLRSLAADDAARQAFAIAQQSSRAIDAIHAWLDHLKDGGHPVLRLVDVNKKKIGFLREVCIQLGLTGDRVDCYDQSAATLEVGSCDRITARAFAPLPKLLRLCESRLSDGGLACLHQGKSSIAEITIGRVSTRLKLRGQLQSDTGDGRIICVEKH